MRCPKCGLIHSAHELVCRRCEIDLKTGESRPRAGTCPLPEPERLSSLEMLRDKMKARVPGKAAKEKDAGDKAAARPASRTSSMFTLKGTKGRSIKDLLGKRGKDHRITTIDCARCASPMTLGREVPYSRNGPIALIVLGVILTVAGIFFHLLWITAVLAVFAGVFYFRFGHTFWKCDACGFIVPRA